MMVLKSEKENVKRHASRVATSATYLVKNVIGCSTADELPTLLASGSGLGGKSSNASSSNSNSRWMEGLPTRASQSMYGLLETCYRGFRSTSEVRAHEDDFEAFMSSCTPVSAGIGIPASAFSTPPIHADDIEIVDLNVKLPACLQETSQSTFDRNAVWDSHTDGLWALESLTTTQLHSSKKDDVRSMLVSTSQTEDYAIFRLKLILGHIVGTVPSTPNVRQHQSVVQRPHDIFARERFLTNGAAPRQSHLDQTSSASVSTTTHVSQYEHLTTNAQREIHKAHHQPIPLYNPRTDRDVTEEQTTQTFHCSWTLCRKVCSLACFLKKREFHANMSAIQQCQPISKIHNWAFTV
jgi:hypothetical protein